MNYHKVQSNEKLLAGFSATGMGQHSLTYFIHKLKISKMAKELAMLFNTRLFRLAVEKIIEDKHRQVT